MAKRFLSAPVAVNLEITELCNVKCRHCYNFWRDESMGGHNLDSAKMDLIIDRLIEAKVFHVVLTGGEPFSNFKILEQALKRLQENDISLSCNSNLMLATPEKCARLAELGLDHILTSLPSCDPAVTDYIMHAPGSFERIMKGIQAARGSGIRVSVNTVVTRKNLDLIYATGKLAAEMDCQKLFVTRAVPPVYAHNRADPDIQLTPEESRYALDQAIQVKEDFGIMIGTLVSYPLCFLGDLERYADFVGRGCPAQAGNLMSLNANGESHACVHEEQSYGNVFEHSIQEIFQSRQMREWHDGSYHHEGCTGCRYIDVCESGCSLTALSSTGLHGGGDPLFVGPDAFSKHFKVVTDPTLPNLIENGLRLVAPKRLRFRKEDNFYMMNIRWANAIPVDEDVALFLMTHRDSGQPFTLDDFGRNRKELLASLLCKDAIEAPDLPITDLRSLQGLSINIDALPNHAAA